MLAGCVRREEGSDDEAGSDTDHESAEEWHECQEFVMSNVEITTEGTEVRHVPVVWIFPRLLVIPVFLL